jgi:Ala-tRNA(Pro) deacylase
MATRAATKALAEYLDRAEVTYELISHRHTESAAAEADALGLDAGEVAKTLVLKTDDANVRAVVPASERLDLAKVREVLGTRDVRLASEDDLAHDYPEFALGAVPPIAGSRHDRVLVDRRLLEHESIVLEAGTHEHSLRLRTSDLVTVGAAKVADLSRE